MSDHKEPTFPFAIVEDVRGPPFPPWAIQGPAARVIVGGIATKAAAANIRDYLAVAYNYGVDAARENPKAPHAFIPPR